MAAVVHDYSEPPSPGPGPRLGPSVEETRLLSAMSDPRSASTHNPPSLLASPRPTPSRVVSTASFISSPLNPGSPSSPYPLVINPFSSARSRPASRSSHLDLTPHHRDPPFSSYAPSSSAYPSNSIFPRELGGMSSLGNRGSMILYRLASEEDGTKTPSSSSRDSYLLLPPKIPGGGNRDSTASSSASSFLTLEGKLSPSYRDSAFPTSRGGLVAYEYDPAADLLDPIDDEDRLHDPKALGVRGNQFPWRGLMNVAALFTLILGLLCLFIFYPVLSFFHNAARNQRIDGNIRINSTGQSPVLFQIPDLVDSETPESAKTRKGFDGADYELVFSDEFNTAGRTFYPGDDPFWEAMDLWYGSTADLEWYDPLQVTTRNGHLVITMDSTSTTQAHITPNSTAPFTINDNHGLQFRSGMLQSWNKFCFSSGYIEVSVVLPGPDQNTQGYWPGAWTMGNLARPGYAATTAGMWPYTYNTCDVGTFPNQTYFNKSGPAAALHSDASRSKYNYELSWLSGQRASACSCPGSDHPGPSVSQGRGAPEIDILEVEKDKVNPVGQVVSQSAQFAPFTADYVYLNATANEFTIYDSGLTRANPYRGSSLQQAVSTLTQLPPDMFQGSGGQFKTLGFEYWANPSTPSEGFITWQVNGQPTASLGAEAVGPDTGPNGSGVGQRLVPLEPMSIVLNLGMSPNWQTIDFSTMIFPAEFLIDYVRVYQRKGHTNIGCNPKAYPTADYINKHIDAYQNPNLTAWNYPIPSNSLYTGC